MSKMNRAIDEHLDVIEKTERMIKSNINKTY